MREGIIETVRPFFVEDDSFSRLMFQTLRRMLQRADIVDLSNTLLAARNFIEEMEPYLNEYRAFQSAVDEEIRSLIPGDVGESDLADNGSGSGIGRNRPGDSDWEDTVREVNASSLPDTDVRTSVQPDGESPGGGHEATMAGNESGNGEESESEIP